MATSGDKSEIERLMQEMQDLLNKPIRGLAYMISAEFINYFNYGMMDHSVFFQDGKLAFQPIDNTQLV